MTDDFRTHTCGECAWITRPDANSGTGVCRRGTWGDTGAQYGLGVTGLTEPACPAYVPRELPLSEPTQETHDEICRTCGGDFQRCEHMDGMMWVLKESDQ